MAAPPASSIGQRCQDAPGSGALDGAPGSSARTPKDAVGREVRARGNHPRDSLEEG
jgi:hypothetical protein